MSTAVWNDPFNVFLSARPGLDPSINVGHNSREIILQVALPGFSRSDIDVEVSNNRLTVRAKSQKKQDIYEFSTREIRQTDFSRSWSLPKSANLDAVDATYDAGILTVLVPYSTGKESVRKIDLH